MRDISFDQCMPISFAVFRDGALKAEHDPLSISVFKLNDQHAFFALKTLRTLTSAMRSRLG